MILSGPSRVSNGRRHPYGVAGLLVPSLLPGLVAIAIGLGGAAAEAKPMKIIAYGDSLTAGYNLPQADSFAMKLQTALRAQGHDVTVVNAGVSGDTTTNGLARLAWTMGDGGDAVILELGANDMLRGVDPKVIKANLAKIIEALKARKVKVLLCGMYALPDMGKPYGDAFHEIYPALAKEYDVPLYGFFLDGIIGDRSQHLPDQMHPNARGVDTIVSHIMPTIDTFLKSVDAKS